MGRAREVDGNKGMNVDGVNFHTGKRDFNLGYSQGRMVRGFQKEEGSPLELEEEELITSINRQICATMGMRISNLVRGSIMGMENI